MAGMLCNHCDFDMEHHGMPNGIQYTAISQRLWDALSPTDKPIIRYIIDFDGFLTVWRCPECGCIHLFDDFQVLLKRVYTPHEQSIAIESPQKYLVFIDYLFEDVADKGWSAEQFLKSGTYGSDRFCYAMVASNGVNVYEDSGCTKWLRSYIARKA